MADDILDAAQKAINDAAKGAESPAPTSVSGLPTEPAPQPVTPAPSAPAEVQKEEPSPEPVNTPPAVPAPEQTKQEEPLDATKQAMVNELLGSATVAPMATPSHTDGPHVAIGTLPPKNKSKVGLILTALATLLLTIPVGVYYVSQQNQQIADVRSRATGGPPEPYSGSIQDCKDDPNAEVVSEPGSPCDCGQYRLECKVGGKWYFLGCGGTRNCGGGGDNPTPTPTPIAPICQNIKIYKAGAQVTPSSLVAGDDVVLAVKGNLSPDKSHFRINGGAWQETTTKNASNEFTLSYTIPDAIPTFVIEAEVFTNGAWR